MFLLQFHRPSSVPLPGTRCFGVYINAVGVRALAIDEIIEIRVVNAVVVLVDGSRQRAVGGGAVDGNVAPDFGRDFEGGLLVRALERILLAGAEFTDNIPVLLLEAAQLLNELILIEIQLEFAPDLVVEGGGVVVVLRRAVWAAALGGVVEEALQQLNFVLVGPEALEQLARFVGRWRLLGGDGDFGLNLLLQVGIGEARDGDRDLGGGDGRGRAIEGGRGGGGGGIVVVVVEALVVVVVVEEVLVLVEEVGGGGGGGGGEVGGGHGLGFGGIGGWRSRRGWHGVIGGFGLVSNSQVGLKDRKSVV